MKKLNQFEMSFVRKLSEYESWVHPLVVYRAVSEGKTRSSRLENVIDQALSESITLAKRLNFLGWIELSVENVAGNRLHLIRLTDDVKKFLKNSENYS